MSEKLKIFFKKHLNLNTQSYEVLMYLITGGLTTIISLASFYLFATILDVDYRFANFISWVLSVLFAYITNRLFVFQSQQHGSKEIVQEFISFTGFRIASFVIDLILLIIFVELFKWESFLAKIVTNIFVLMLNYLFSKFYVFNKKEKKRD